MFLASRDTATSVIDHVVAFEHAASAFVAAVRGADPDRPVPTCPGWSSYDLVVHLGNVHARVATILETGQNARELGDRPRDAALRRALRRGPQARGLAEWYAGRAEDLLRVLRDVDPEAPCWTFSAGHGTAGFWRRRQVHETTVHLVDLQLSGGAAAGVLARGLAPPLAADGVGEVLEVLMPRMHATGHPVVLDAPVLLHADDVGLSWLVQPDGPGRAPLSRVVAGRELVGERVDLVRGTAASLYLLLWKRLPLDAPGVELDGDQRRLRAFLSSRLTG